MEYVGITLMILGLLLSSIYWINIVILAFENSFHVGLVVTLVPFAGVWFVLDNWAETKTLFKKNLIGWAVIGLGLCILLQF